MLGDSQTSASWSIFIVWLPTAASSTSKFAIPVDASCEACVSVFVLDSISATCWEVGSSGCKLGSAATKSADGVDSFRISSAIDAESSNNNWSSWVCCPPTSRSSTPLRPPSACSKTSLSSSCSSSPPSRSRPSGEDNGKASAKAVPSCRGGTTSCASKCSVDASSTSLSEGSGRRKSDCNWREKSGSSEHWSCSSSAMAHSSHLGGPTFALQR
mmetsp:Transcript_21993/g.75428  ORF Transcript_21993/g.75428 Transcript_21993/m.75428 type:complete len:214 (+) Transcript_21993:3823-4464(+)